MTRITTLLIALLAIMHGSCRKRVVVDMPPETCSWKSLTSVNMGKQGILPIIYNADGTIKRMGHDLTYFNNGQLMEVIRPTDTVAFDSIGRLRYLKTDFDFTGGRQTRYYFYDDQNRVVKTLTHTGDGINYIQALTYENGDVVEMAFDHDSIRAQASRMRYTYYDTLCVDHYLGMNYWAQIGQTQNKHLLKTSRHDEDTTYYSYVLDSNQRVLVSYRNYDNSGWYYERAVDTTWYTYSCN